MCYYTSPWLPLCQFPLHEAVQTSSSLGLFFFVVFFFLKLPRSSILRSAWGRKCSPRTTPGAPQTKQPSDYRVASASSSTDRLLLLLFWWLSNSAEGAAQRRNIQRRDGDPSSAHQGRVRSADRRRSPGGSDGLRFFLLAGGSRRIGEDGDPR